MNRASHTFPESPVFLVVVHSNDLDLDKETSQRMYPLV